MPFFLMAVYQLKLNLRNRVAIAAVVSLPLLLTYLFSYSQGSGGSMSLYVADLDQSARSGRLIQLLSSHGSAHVKLVSEETVEAKVNDQELPLGLVIERGFGKPIRDIGVLPVKIIQNVETSESEVLAQLIEGSVETERRVAIDAELARQTLSIDSEAFTQNVVKKATRSGGIVIEDQSLGSGNAGPNNATARFLGFFVMFLWFVVVQALRSFLDEKANQTFQRIVAAPLCYFKHVLSKMAAAYLFGLFVVMVGLLAAWGLLHVQLGEHAAAVGIFFAVYVFALASLTLAAVPFMKDQKQFTSSFAILIAVTGMLGGSFFPLDIAPRALQNLAKFTPERWAIQALQELVFHAGTLNGVAAPLIVLGGAGVLAMAAAFLFMNRSLTHGRV